MKHLYFVRHGLSEANLAGVWSGQVETPLASEGRMQAELAGQYARGLAIQQIVCSPLGRAQETADIIARQIGYPLNQIEVNALLIERGFGVKEGAPYVPDYDFSNVADAETNAALQARVEQVWQHLKTITVDNVLVVSHGSTGRMLRHVIDPKIPFTKSPHYPHFPNAEIIQLV